MGTLVERVIEAGLPRHVAIVMDGNGRWAAERGLPRAAGHQEGSRAAERLIRFAGERLGLEALTLYAFSCENWNRPQSEIDFLMDLLEQFIEEQLEAFVQAGVHLSVFGDLAGLPDRVRTTVENAMRRTADCDQLRLNIALNYGGRQELTRASRMLAEDVVQGRLALNEIDEEQIGRRLYSASSPELDLMIRTSGEQRLSNFLLWQTAYAELVFTDTLWPDYTPAEFVRALETFQKRERRFGGIREEHV